LVQVCDEAAGHRDFGAVGDWFHDDTDAIRAAVMPLASEILASHEDLPPLREDNIVTTCRVCGTLQSLDRATLDQADPLETVYRCLNGCEPILIVTTPGVVPWEGRGYRLGDWVIRNPGDL
jgi:hypothetical protein